MPENTIVLEGVLQPDQEKTYVHLPFEVPARAERMDVALRYDARIGSNPLLKGGNTIDLGIFDSGGIDFLSAGFRGWSGSERDAFMITPDEATPGYLAGLLPAGRWHVLLGLYKIAPQGCRYRVSIQIQTRPEVEGQALGLRRVSAGDLPGFLPAASFGPWLRGELHCHTWHSDGDNSAANLVALARRRGLDFLAVTDHNNISQQRELEQMGDPGLILIRGMEVTTYKGHFNVWGTADWVDFRVQSPQDMQAALRFAAERGGLTSIGHPKPFGPDWDYPEVTNAHCVEVWNGPWTLLNQIALDYWSNLIASGRQVPAVGGSDYHGQDQQPELNLGIPTTWAYVPGTPKTVDAAAILRAVRAGHVSLSDAPDGPFLDLRAGSDYKGMAGDRISPVPPGKLPVQVRCLHSAGCRLALIDQQGSVFNRKIEQEDQLVQVDLFPGKSRFIRAELRTANESLRAMTNPIYF